MTARPSWQRGISLIEALVALAVMALGMMSVVGLQVTLRSNGDLSRQRAEAVRIAQESVEDWRSFAVIDSDAALLDYQELVSDGPTVIAGQNASYSRVRTVASSASPPLKTLSVTVSWTDRSNEAQSVALQSTIAGVTPELAGTLAVPPQGVPTRQPRGRHRSIPLPAHDLGNGTSVFKPPLSGTVAWVFDNTTGLIKGVCTVDAAATSDTILLTDVEACSNNATAQLLTGHVRFAALGSPPGAAEAQAPTGTILNLDIDLVLTSAGHPALDHQCFDDSTDDAVAASVRGTINYYCAVYSNAAGKWSGRSRITPLGFGADAAWPIASSGAGNYKVCRYTPLAGVNPDIGAPDDPTNNDKHPLDYTANGSIAFASLTNQNFLVIAADHTCPVDAVADGDFLNSNTRLHEDGTPHFETPPAVPTPL